MYNLFSNLNNKIVKNIIVVPIVLSILFGTLSYQKAEAFASGSVIIDGFQMVKDLVTAAIIATVKQELTEALIKETAGWVGSGYSGQGLMLDNPEMFIKNLATEQLSITKDKILKDLGYANTGIVASLISSSADESTEKAETAQLKPSFDTIICDKLKAELDDYQALDNSDDLKTLLTESKQKQINSICTAGADGKPTEEGFSKAKECLSDFACSGWAGILAVTNDQDKNIESNRLATAKGIYEKNKNKEQTKAKEQTNRSGGYLDQVECNDGAATTTSDGIETCKSSTVLNVGSIVQALAAKVGGTPFANIENADEWMEIAGAMISNYISGELSKGFKNMYSKSGSSQDAFNKGNNAQIDAKAAAEKQVKDAIADGGKETCEGVYSGPIDMPPTQKERIAARNRSISYQYDTEPAQELTLKKYCALNGNYYVVHDKSSASLDEYNTACKAPAPSTTLLCDINNTTYSNSAEYADKCKKTCATNNYNYTTRAQYDQQCQDANAKPVCIIEINNIAYLQQPKAGTKCSKYKLTGDDAIDNRISGGGDPDGGIWLNGSFSFATEKAASTTADKSCRIKDGGNIRLFGAYDIPIDSGSVVNADKTFQFQAQNLTIVGHIATGKRVTGKITELPWVAGYLNGNFTPTQTATETTTPATNNNNVDGGGF